MRNKMDIRGLQDVTPSSAAVGY